jgi:dTDP-glucose pyrophosphorylase
MAGSGQRFKNAGYTIPKFMIEVQGKTLFEWSMKSLNSFIDEKYYFIVRKKDNASEFINEKCKKIGINNFEIIELENNTRGQAETAIYAVKLCNPKDEILIYNIDTYINYQFLKKEDLIGDGCIPCFEAPGEHWSFVKVDENNCALEVREKERISKYASIGAYYFKNAQEYIDIFNEFYIKNNNLEKGEMYVAPLYNRFIELGKKVTMMKIPSSEVHVLGTPEEIEIFKNN